jgi:hypothetical protein
MNNTLRIILIASIVVVLSLGLFFGGMFLGQNRYGYSMMNGFLPYGMMGSYSNSNYSNVPNSNGSGMMGGGMMGGYGSGLTSTKTITEEEAKKAVDAYLAGINDSDLELDEIMIFDNGGYAIVKEISTGVGAFELLIDPVALTAYPEYGPNMMWNLKYGMMSGNASYGGYGMMGGGMMGGGMMGRWNNSIPAEPTSDKMPVSSDQALEYAQKYLDNNLPGVKVSEEITPFYGYYTIDLDRDGKIIGMLSVNGYSGQVFLHTWHGIFIEMIG